ncbi:hypothetical protein QBC34DRAFT_118525 [Podospora aff. communis PSN243]|uniref:SAP domain-containing protein n=1 Tax=Podospora aff. communis PSN243 TaxID=3040156 RepID=A0AAV9GJ34_9PEZI|nr:hypothetical protein QBC34DRAFT_118525 [Podospora aff. communis PSN243]
MATDWSRLTVADLRVELRRRGLPPTGKKADLVERLTSADNEAPSDEKPADEAPDQTSDQADNCPVAVDSPKDEAASSEPHMSPAKGADAADEFDKTTKDLAAGSQSPPPKEVTTADATTQPALEPSTSAPSDEPTLKKNEETASAEPASAALEVSQDPSRKRRSRSPPPDDEISRKRARPSEGEQDTMPLDILSGKDVSYAILEPTVPSHRPDSRAEPPSDENEQHAKRDASMALEDRMDYRHEEDLRPTSRDRDTRLSHDSIRNEDDRQVAPAEHPATPALYIKNFMRPLRDSELRDYLCELATPRGAEIDLDAVEDFFLDQIRTHAFVLFRNTSSASRVRVALHGQVWPDERNRKALWVDFIPPEKIADWADQEKTEGGRGTRWEVRYDFDHDGNATARLTNATLEPPRQPARLEEQRPPASAPASSIPTGPSRPFGGVEGAPLGPRGRGSASYRQDAFPAASGEWTHAGPSIAFKPVPKDLAERRIDNMRSYYTKDRYRDMGREDEINRYTFENQDGFVDRGKENFVGIRPPHREREVQQRRAMERGNRGQSSSTHAPPIPRGGDRYYGTDRDGDRNGGYRDEAGRNGGRSGGYRDEPNYGGEPRSRLDGAIMPTFDAYRGGGRGGRRGWNRR